MYRFSLWKHNWLARYCHHIPCYFSRNVNMAKSLQELHFVNGVLKHLPLDQVQDNFVRTVNNACFSLIKPTPLQNPQLVCYSTKALELLDLDEKQIDKHFIDCFAGNVIINGSETAAHCYCGHQFGNQCVVDVY